jgi:hypothetical protein
MANRPTAGLMWNSLLDTPPTLFLSLRAGQNSAAGGLAHILHKPLNYNELLMSNRGHSNAEMDFFPDLREERPR